MNAMTNASIQMIALGNEDGEARFVVSENPSWGKLGSAGAPNAIIGEQTARIRRLNSLIRARTVPSPDLIKIDVEGAR